MDSERVGDKWMKEWILKLGYWSDGDADRGKERLKCGPC